MFKHKLQPRYAKYLHSSLFIMVLFFLQACGQNTSATVEVEEPWIRTPAPSAQALAGFMLLKNHSDTPIALLQAKAEGFNHVMLHQSINKNGMHKMEHSEKIIIPPQGDLSFQHGGYHIMFMGIQKKVKSGDNISVTLIFDNGQEKQVSYIVKDPD